MIAHAKGAKDAEDVSTLCQMSNVLGSMEGRRVTDVSTMCQMSK